MINDYTLLNNNTLHTTFYCCIMQNVIFYTCAGCLLVVQKYESSVGLGAARTLTFSFTPIAEASRSATVLQVHYNYYKSPSRIFFKVIQDSWVVSRIIGFLSQKQMQRFEWPSCCLRNETDVISEVCKGCLGHCCAHATASWLEHWDIVPDNMVPLEYYVLPNQVSAHTYIIQCAKSLRLFIYYFTNLAKFHVHFNLAQFFRNQSHRCLFKQPQSWKSASWLDFYFHATHVCI